MELYPLLFCKLLSFQFCLGILSFNEPGTILFCQFIRCGEFHLRPYTQLNESFFFPFFHVIAEIENLAARRLNFDTKSSSATLRAVAPDIERCLFCFQRSEERRVGKECRSR